MGKISNSCHHLDLGPTMPKIELVQVIFIYYNIIKFHVPRKISFRVIMKKHTHRNTHTHTRTHTHTHAHTHTHTDTYRRTQTLYSCINNCYTEEIGKMLTLASKRKMVLTR